MVFMIRGRAFIMGRDRLGRGREVEEEEEDYD